MILIAERTQKYLKKAFKLGQVFCSHPYTWNDTDNRPQVSTSILRILGWYINVAVSFAYFAFIVRQCIVINYSEESHSSAKVFVLFAVVFFAFPLFFNCTYILRKSEMATVIHGTMLYCQWFEDNYIKSTAKPSKFAKLCGWTMMYVYYAFTVDVVLLVLFGALIPESPIQLASVITATLTVKRALNVIFFTYYMVSYVANGCIMISGFVCLFTQFQILDEFGKRRSSFTGAHLQNPVELIRVYSCLQFLIEAIMHVYLIICASAKLILMICGVFCTYGAVRLNGFTVITLAVLGASTLVCLAVLMNGWAQVHSTSSKALVTLRSLTGRVDAAAVGTQQNREWMRKSVSSLQLMKVPMMFRLYYVHKAQVLDVFRVVCEGVIFLLVNY